MPREGYLMLKSGPQGRVSKHAVSFVQSDKA